MNKSLAKSDDFGGLPPWVAKMRAAAIESISEADIKAIVQKQVAKAKDGDPNAIRFVFDQLLGGAAMKGATFVQNNFSDGPGPNDASDAIPGTKQKLDVIRRRVEGRQSTSNNGDRAHVNLD